MKRLDIYAESRNFGRDIAIHIEMPRDPLIGVVVRAKPIEFSNPQEEGDSDFCPTIELRVDDARRLMDQLWNAGIRPTEGAGSAGSLAATQKHLEDMRTIAMGAMKKEGLL